MCALTKLADSDQIDFEKLSGLVPAIIIDVRDNAVLMLGFMNRKALDQSIRQERVIFYSRTKQRLWRKGETSGNELKIISMEVDCDQDSLIVYAESTGPTCHTGERSCFKSQNQVPSQQQFAVLTEIEATIREREASKQVDSYVCKLLNTDRAFLAAKVIEEAVETGQAFKKEGPERTISEAADLIFHLLVLLRSQGLELADICRELGARRQKLPIQGSAVEENTTLI